MSDPAWLERVEHTADTGIAVRAATCADLYGRAAWGMFAIVCDMSVVGERSSRRVRINAPDREELMVRWLSELNVWHETEMLLCSRFTVQHVSATRLVADVGAEPIDEGRHNLYTTIKAVTYCGLEVVQVGNVWTARVIFDV